MAQGRITTAEKSYRHAVDLDRNCSQTHEALAMFLATQRPQDGGCRKRAYAEAIIACELAKWEQWTCLETLAIACAANQDFGEAVGWLKKSVDRAPSSCKSVLKDRLSSYEQKKLALAAGAPPPIPPEADQVRRLLEVGLKSGDEVWDAALNLYEAAKARSGRRECTTPGGSFV